jgi:preprotein translocase subunit SecA
MATQPNKISLMTSSFGRGTDFQIFDPKVNEKGGLHIIQTFLSIDQSEEIQIMGRTNRQNNNGSYDCIFKKNELEALKIAEDIKKVSKDEICKILLNSRLKIAEELNTDVAHMV